MMTLVSISVVTVGAYLYFNFKSRSSLPVIVPQDVRAFMHFQTRKMRDDSEVKQPPYMDSLIQLIRNAPLFATVKDPSETGISLYSDIVYFFTKEKSHVIALSLNSEQRFSNLLDTLRKQGVLSGQIVKPAFNYAKFENLSLYVAYKYKAMVLVQPSAVKPERALSNDEIEMQLASIFSGKSTGFIKRKDLQSLYSADCQWLAWNGEKPVGFAFDEGKANAFEGFEDAAKPASAAAQVVFNEMRPAKREISPENKNFNETQNGIEMLNTYFKEVFEFLDKKQYEY
jgi:hypothetical protein